MSAIAGFLAAAPRPDATELLTALAAPLEDQGPDGLRAVHRGRIGLLHRPFRTVPGVERRPQPLESPSGVLLAWDGRLDDGGHDEASSAGGEAGDAERALAAYERLGRGFVDHLVGDFAAAVWDPRTERLLLARDPFSPRELFYAHADDGTFLFASTVTALLAAGGIDDGLDEEWALDFLCSLRPAERTVYRRVRAVPPGHVLQIDRDGLHLHRYWPGEHVGEVRCSDDGEYAERFRGLLADAVRHRLRRTGPVFAELSGGFDSSSIVCLADRRLRAEGAGDQDLQTVSYVFDEAPDSDERAFIRPVEDQVRRPSLHVSDRDARLFDELEEPWGEQPSHGDGFRSRFRHLGRRMANTGSRVLLSGVAGDDVALSQASAPPQLTDLAAAGRLPSLWRELRRWRPELDLPYATLAWRGAVVPLLPAVLQKRLTYGSLRVDFLAPKLRRRLEQERRARGLYPGEPERHLRRWSLRERTASLRYTIREQVQPRYQMPTLLGAEMRYPFLHRPLVEFALGVPIDQLMRPGETRSLHARALADVLPPAILRRRDKRGPTEAMMRALDHQWPELSRMFHDDALVYQAGWVDRERFLRSLQWARFGRSEQAGPVRNVIDLEVWLRWHHRASRSSAVADRPLAATCRAVRSSPPAAAPSA